MMRGPLETVDWISISLASAIILGTLAAPHAAAAGLLPDGSVCLSQRIAGVGCPGCGLSRSVIALGSGDLARALHLNWVAPVMLLIAVAHLFARGSKASGATRNLRSFDLSTLAVIVAVLVVRSIQIWT